MTRSEDSAVLDGVVDGYNQTVELSGQSGQRPIVVKKFNVKNVLLTWGGLIFAVLSGAAVLGWKYNELCNQVENNTETNTEFKTKVEQNTKAITEQHLVLTEVKNTQGINGEYNKERFDRQERLLERIAEQVGAMND